MSFTDFIAGQSDAEPEVEIHGDDIWEILFTSGTTALPKGVMISHTCSYMAALGFAQSLTRGLRIENDLRLCSYLPMLYHVGDQPFVYSVFLSAGTLLLGRRPDPAAIARSVAAERLTALWAGSPAMLRAIDTVLHARPGPGRHQPEGRGIRVGGAAPGDPGVAEAALRARLPRVRDLRADRVDQLLPVLAGQVARAVRAHRPAAELRGPAQPAAGVHGHGP